MASDATGKVSFDHIYAQSDPRAYFSTLRKLHYCIPQLAKPYFLALSNQYRQAQQVRQLTILDVGCSYGINAALMKCEATMDELSERYDGRAAARHPGEHAGARPAVDPRPRSPDVRAVRGTGQLAARALVRAGGRVHR